MKRNVYALTCCALFWMAATARATEYVCTANINDGFVGGAVQNEVIAEDISVSSDGQAHQYDTNQNGAAIVMKIGDITNNKVFGSGHRNVVAYFVMDKSTLGDDPKNPTVRNDAPYVSLTISADEKVFESQALIFSPSGAPAKFLNVFCQAK